MSDNRLSSLKIYYLRIKLGLVGACVYKILGGGVKCKYKFKKQFLIVK